MIVILDRYGTPGKDTTFGLQKLKKGNTVTKVYVMFLMFNNYLIIIFLILMEKISQT